MITEVSISNTAIAAQVQAVCQAAYRVEAELIGFGKLPPLIETAEDLQRSKDRFLVHQREGAIIGALSFHSLPEAVIISRLVVMPAYSRQGIGTALLCALESEISRTSPILVTTAQANRPAVQFYERNGFVAGEVTMIPGGLVLLHLAKEARDR